MTDTTRFTRRIQNRFFRYLLLFHLLMGLLVGAASAQTTTRPTDGNTPLGIAPGTPAGSYALSGFDNVNLFNGHLNFQLPLRSIGGRGSAGYTMTLAIESQWTVTHQTQLVGCFPSGLCTYNHIFYPGGGLWGALPVGFGPGVLKGRKASDTACAAGTPNAGALYDKLTRITFTTPGGTEYEMIDKLTGGQVISNSSAICFQNGQTSSRGRVFVTADGTAATFISDTTIHDTSGTYEEFYPSGYMLLRDGTRYRIRNGVVDWMLDRNGNKLTFTYDGNARVTSIKDSMDRVVTVSYANFTTTFETLISFNGSGGLGRTIRISYSQLGAILKAQNPNVTTPQTYAQLFPELNGASTSTTYNPYLTASVELPNGRTYQFKYNEYGEMARVVLPTGGAYEYDYGPGRYESSPSGVVNSSSTNFFVYRRIVERRVYKDGGSVPESRTTYSRPELYPSESGPVQVDHLDSSGTTLLAREKHYFYNTALQSIIAAKPTGYPFWTDGKEYKAETFDGAGTTVLRRVEHTWTQGTGPAPPYNARITQILTTLEPTSANLVAKQTFTYDQYNNPTDSYEYDFGTGAPATNYTRRTHTEYLTTHPVNGAAYDTVNPDNTNPDVAATIHIRNLPTKNQVFDVSGAEKARTTYEYDNYVPDPPSNAHAALIARSGITGLCDGSLQNCPNQPNFNDPNYQKRGNLTGKTSFANPASESGPVTSFAQYDVAGNPVASIDRLSRQTTFSYADAFCNGSTCGGTFIANTFALVSGTASPVPDPTGQYGATTALTTSSVYDFWTGQVASYTDANNQTTEAHYNDVLERPTQVIRAVGTTVANQSTFSYDDAARIVTTTADLNSYPDNVLKSQTLYDGLGRVIETRKYETASDYIAIQQVPFVVLQDGSNWLRASQTSNPFRLNEQPAWTTTFSDSLGRVIKVKTHDNSVVTTAYSGKTVTVTDQIGNKRKSVNDAMGRLTAVYEDPLNANVNYQTSYGYDVLDNLVSVTQGSQQRFFMYDSLKRLIRARNPEQDINPSLNLSDPITGNSQWNMAYQYDNNGNLTQKTDARGVISVYAYDALNRNTTVDYSDTTSINPDITSIYDTATNGKGRLRERYAGGTETTGATVEHTKIVSYDALGRPLDQRQRFKTNSVWSANEFRTQRGYNLAGGVTSQIYPSLRTVSYDYDDAGRLKSFTGNLGDNVTRNYSTEIVYSSLGGMAKEKFGTDTTLYNKSFYNSRGQLSEIRVGTTYNGPTDTDWQRGAIINHFSNQCWGACNGTDNNGNLKSQDHWIPDSNGATQAVFTQTYSYDSLNRLQRVQEGSWQQEYVVDRWGNRTIHQTNTTGTGINKKDFSVNTANNRLGVPAGQSGVMTYDAAGNLTNDTYTGAGSRVYDAENRITKAWGGNNQEQEYTYNANGNRVRRKIDGIETRQIYGMGGELLAEYPANGAANNPTKEYGYRNGQLLIIAAAGSSGWGAPPTFQENPLVIGDTPIRSVHITELRSAIDAVRSHFNLGPYSWQTAAAPGDLISTAPIQEMRTALDQALGAPAGGYAAGLAAGQLILKAHIQELRDRVSAAWQSGSGAADIRWLIADQLGTPRIVLDKSGSLANTTRHDYLPFGEELFAGRTTGLGYTNDTTRQKFTSKERDVETGLDYFGARYYSLIQGRFTSPDPLHASATVTDPQSFNRYSYVRNMPLISIDPNGLDDCVIGKTCSFTTLDWATSGNHPEEGQIQESVTLIIPPATPIATSSTDPGAVSLNFRDLTQPVLMDQTATPGAGDPATEGGGGISWGVTASGTIAGGIGLAGAGATGGGFWGYFDDPDTGFASTGGGLEGGAEAYILAGDRARTPRAIVSAVDVNDDDDATVVGASAGVGVGLFFTNAKRPEELRGPFQTYQINTPWFGAQWDQSGNTKVFSFTLGPSLGASYWSGKTASVTTPALPRLF
jgi:RHS repeat-associated protein